MIPSSAIFPLVMTMTSSSGTAGDLHGAANSGIQNVGASLNLSTNPIAGNSVGSFVQLTNSTALGALGIVTDFTATVWIKMPVIETNMLNQGSRIYNLVGSGITDIGGVNSIGFQPQLASPGRRYFLPFVMRAVIGNQILTPPIWYTWPTNEWIFLARPMTAPAAMRACITARKPARPNCMW